MSYDFAVVGAGMFGASFARAAADAGKKILLLERRRHVGGNCHTEDRNGVQVHVYGPHVFHTDDPELWAWIGRFGEFRPMICRNVAMARGRLWPLPMNLMLFHQLWGVKTPDEARKAVAERRVLNADTSTLRGWVLANLGEEVFETFINGYSRKQWGRDPDLLPASIVQRLPIRYTHDQNYFRDRFQGVPVGGYAALFERMLDHPMIEVRTGFHFDAERSGVERLAGHVIYSGRIDEYHDFKLGRLHFRSARFEHKTMEGDYQGHYAVYYCDRDVPQTRVIEHKHFTNPDWPKTVVSYEYPYECEQVGDIPMYPIEDERNRSLYTQYRALPARAVFGGRLGHYSYMDMNQAVAEARKLVEKLS